MKSFMKSLKRQDGFTLVELMVVVAIIGVLSAVAIPNFKKYQAKAKTSEAKLQLSAAYTAQQSFYSDYNIYHICLGYMGFNPDNEKLQRFFMVGFAASATLTGAPLTQAAVNGLDATACSVTGALLNSQFAAGKILSGFVVDTDAEFIANAAGAVALLGAQTAGAETFKIAAVGAVDSTKITGPLAAGFTIDHNKVISQMSVGY